MIDLLLIPIAILYLLVVGLLFVYGLHFFYLTYISWRDRGRTPAAPPLVDYPPVTVQLPVYNELYVVKRLIDAAANLDYPAERLEIQVLDDSTDETSRLVLQLVKAWSARGVNIVHLHRTRRQGFKAGALEAGLKQSNGEFLAIFDADFIPPPDFLLHTIPHFQDPQVAFVQTRWGHVNRDYSILSALQAISIDAHFVVEQFARYRAGLLFNFNGTAGIWRREAVDAAGGWAAETLTEDLDLSYRAFLNGWQAVFLRDVIAPAELPVSFTAFRRQQQRWASGSLQCALRILPEVWNAPFSLSKKIGATLHLTGYGVHLLLFALSLMYPLILLLSQRYPQLTALFGIAFIFNATAFAPTLFFISAQMHIERQWWRRLPASLLISVLGMGMMVNTVRAAWQILNRQPTTFKRTPKYGVQQRSQDWIRQRYQLRLDPIVFFELLFVLFNLATVLYAVSIANWTIAIYAGLFGAGLLFTSLYTIIQAVQTARRKRTAYKDTVYAGD